MRRDKNIIIRDSTSSLREVKQEDHGIFIAKQINQFLDDSRTKSKRHPTFTIITGGVCVGKTRLRREKYSKGHVLIDAAEIFLSLCSGKELDFPSIHKKEMNKIGTTVAYRALKERRNIVTELIGSNAAELKSLIDAIKQTGYKVVLVHLKGHVEEAWMRNIFRGANNISAYYCEPYHMKWVHSGLRSS
jgi:hypothetical protein